MKAKTIAEFEKEMADKKKKGKLWKALRNLRKKKPADIRGKTKGKH
jgi:hypothetical protein